MTDAANLFEPGRAMLLRILGRRKRNYQLYDETDNRSGGFTSKRRMRRWSRGVFSPRGKKAKKNIESDRMVVDKKMVMKTNICDDRGSLFILNHFADTCY